MNFVDLFEFWLRDIWIFHNQFLVNEIVAESIVLSICWLTI